MRPRRRISTYLLINIFVSALVTGTLIFFYNRAHPAVCTPLPVVPVPTGGADINVNITSVMGAGTLADERIVIRNDESQELILTGWTLVDPKGDTYTFPELTLHPGVKVQLHTAAGTNSPTDLYWGLSSPAWSSGELAALYDPENIARAFYRIP